MQFISKLFGGTPIYGAKKIKNSTKIRKNALFIWRFHKNILPLHSQNGKVP